MPRKPRQKSSSGIYHIMLRGINKQTIFEQDEDRDRLLETIKKYKERCNFKLHGYCFMDNHIHLLFQELDESVSKTIMRISASYVYWYNYKYERCGHLFQERFKSENVETVKYFKTVLRYIHRNPVKAGLAKNVLECQWTSLPDYYGKPEFIDIEFGLQLFASDQNVAIKLFTEFMQESSDDQCLDVRENLRMHDSDIRRHLQSLGIANSSALQQLEKEKRNAFILELKQLQGVSIRQLSRVTGISKSVIDRIRW